jgi:DNA-directed RNA polymerase specialized sigma24 family protein
MLTEYYYRLRPLKEIAAANSVSEGAVKAMLYRARRAFKAAFLKLADSFNAALEPEGGSDG